MLEFVFNVFNKSPHWAVFFVSLCPMIESKVAIPFGLTKEIWAGVSISPFAIICMAFLGSMLPCVLILLLFKFIKKHACGMILDKVLNKIEKRYKRNFEKLNSKQSELKKCVLLASFVAIPLPLTGVYAGSIIGGLSNLKLWQSFLSIAVGELVSCAIVLMLCTIFKNSILYILIFSLIIVMLTLIINLFISIFAHKKRKEM